MTARRWEDVREERLARMTPEERATHVRRVAKIVETWRRLGIIPQDDEEASP